MMLFKKSRKQSKQVGALEAIDKKSTESSQKQGRRGSFWKQKDANSCQYLDDCEEIDPNECSQQGSSKLVLFRVTEVKGKTQGQAKIFGKGSKPQRAEQGLVIDTSHSTDQDDSSASTAKTTNRSCWFNTPQNGRFAEEEEIPRTISLVTSPKKKKKKQKKSILSFIRVSSETTA
ncbi:expressed unknown protein [Seminavis robusta]|uniref:Uncharacterized protein n=1 Tax=Seminavis robusta TaxID=568900 RepID=A0A9N8ELK7_9STRA|nr:expressed unknown protein [Seminavis robusta]|eukprot:Sro1170_g248680.1 n/a (175) ;mRNA; f:5954-6478